MMSLKEEDAHSDLTGVCSPNPQPPPLPLPPPRRGETHRRALNAGVDDDHLKILDDW